METDDSASPTDSKSRSTRDGKRLSPERTRRLLMSPVKKLSALRLVSPIDSDQELIDLEVASVLAEGNDIFRLLTKRTFHNTCMLLDKYYNTHIVRWTVCFFN